MIRALVKKYFSVDYERSAEKIIQKMNSDKLRSLEVEMLYNEVRYQFKENMINGKLKRWSILQIRGYLEKNVRYYTHKKFKNDAHAIYTMLKASDITSEDLKTIKKMLR